MSKKEVQESMILYRSIQIYYKDALNTVRVLTETIVVLAMSFVVSLIYVMIGCWSTMNLMGYLWMSLCLFCIGVCVYTLTNSANQFTEATKQFPRSFFQCNGKMDKDVLAFLKACPPIYMDVENMFRCKPNTAALATEVALKTSIELLLAFPSRLA